MSTFVDCHVHLYPLFDPEQLVLHAQSNAQAVSRAAARESPEHVVLLLTERSGQREFQKLAERAKVFGGRPASLSEDGSCLLLAPLKSEDLLILLFAGRQLVSAEGLEVLSLLAHIELDDGLPAADLIEAILSAGGVPCIPWSPGKWLFRRGQTLKGLVQHFGEALLLGDIPMRPRGFPRSGLLASAFSRGHLLAGSDPLPVQGEERAVASYGIYLPTPLDLPRAQSSLRSHIMGPVTPVGQRNSLAQAARRWLAHRATAGG